MNRHLKNFLLRGRAELIDLANRMKSNKAIFEGIYKKGGWRNEESVSGSGSTLRNTKGICDLLPVMIDRYNIETMLDIPCGDFNWMKEVSLGTVRYYGSDIVEDLVRKNQERYAGDKKTFFVADIANDKLPKVDLIFCRDCLPHLSEKEVKRALNNIARSGSKYLLTTTFPGQKNHDIVTGNWRPLNLNSAPYNLPQSLEMFPEAPANHQLNKSLGLWMIESITNIP